jgi:hypothetical protein
MSGHPYQTFYQPPPLPQEHGLSFGPPVIFNAHKPISIVDTDGKVHEPSENRERTLPSCILTFDSRDRDRTVNPSAAKFRLMTPEVLKTVHSIELIEAIIPVVAAPTSSTNTTPEPYVVMRIKGFDVSDSGHPFTNSSTYFNPVSQEAFAHFYLADAIADGRTYIKWTRNRERRIIKQFTTPLLRVDHLDVSFVVRTAGSNYLDYPIPAEAATGGTDPRNNVLLTFEVVCT